MSELRTAVHNLTRDTVTIIDQMADSGKWLKAHTITHPALLQQLEDQIGATFGGADGGGGSSPASTRNLLDSDALYEFGKITTQISDWCRARRLTPTRHPIPDLEAWHRSWDGMDVLAETFYVRTLERWADIIKFMLNPTKRIELTSDCPICGAGSWMDLDGSAYKFPLLMEYKGADGAVEDEHAMCRACSHLWNGQRELRQLRWDIDAREAG